MDLSFLSNYFVPMIAGICLCVGFVLKSTNFIPNKYIPLINGIIGISISIWTKYPLVTPECILSGLFSGLASTGLYEAFRNMLGDKNV